MIWRKKQPSQPAKSAFSLLNNMVAKIIAVSDAYIIDLSPNDFQLLWNLVTPFQRNAIALLFPGYDTIECEGRIFRLRHNPPLPDRKTQPLGTFADLSEVSFR